MAIGVVAFPKQFQVFFITQILAVEPVGRAEGDEAGHSRPAATARDRSTHRLAVRRAGSTPAPSAGDGSWCGRSLPPSAAAQYKLRPPGRAVRFALRPGSLCRPGGNNGSPLLSGSRDTKKEFRSLGIPSSGQIRWMELRCPFLCLLSLRPRRTLGPGETSLSRPSHSLLESLR